MKQLKFSEPLPNLILNGEKNTTWRINDTKEISEGDEISLCHNKGLEFAKIKALYVEEKPFKNLTEKDKEGHEKFENDEEMYATYSKYYQTTVGPNTKVKIVKFKLI